MSLGQVNSVLAEFRQGALPLVLAAPEHTRVADEVFGIASGNVLSQGGPSRAYGRLHVLDVSDIDRPREVAWYEPQYGGVHNVWVAGDTLYMGAYNAGFIAFDISGELRVDLRAQGREIATVSTPTPPASSPTHR